MEVDDTPAPGVDTVENTDIASLVEALYEYTPRDLKSLLVPEMPYILEIPAEKTGPGIRQRVDLAKLCRYLPRHILACSLKEDDQYWVSYLVKAQKLLLHLVKFAVKRGGVLAQHIFSNIGKIIDLCIMATVIGIQTLAATESIDEFQTSLEMFKQVFSLLDYFLDAELASPKQPFMDAMIAHPKSFILSNAILDGLKLILQHRNLLPPREDGKTNPAITRTLIAVFDVLDILAMSDEFVSKLIDKSQGYLLVDLCLTIFKDHTRLGHPVLFATLKLLYRLCEEEPTFINGVLNSPACTRFNLVIAHVIDVASDILGPSKLSHSIRSEATKIVYALAKESNYRRTILEKGTPFFLKFLSLPPNDFSALFKDVSASEMVIYVFASIGYLHAQPRNEAVGDKSFFDQTLQLLQSNPSSLILKKAYSSLPSFYTPTILVNINAILNEILTQPKWKDELSLKITKRHVSLVIAYRTEIEKAIGLSSSQFDALIAEPLAHFGENPARSSSGPSTTSNPLISKAKPVSSTKPPKPKAPL